MQTYWLNLWRDLAIKNQKTNLISKKPETSIEYLGRQDPLMDFALGNMGEIDSVLDIGAGTGRWTLPLADKARQVTAIEPSEKMLNLLQDNILSSKKTNILIVRSTWENAADIKTHDIAVCAHGIYTSPDFSGYIRKMEKLASKQCYLELRLPPADGVIGELYQQIYGVFHDSPNAVVAYNALYEMGIYPNMMIEEGISNWVDHTLDEAKDRAKFHLHLKDVNYDILIKKILSKRLHLRDNSYIWPDGMRSALIWWNTAPS
jgi:SAM-dependent methyltransferase